MAHSNRTEEEDRGGGVNCMPSLSLSLPSVRPSSGRSISLRQTDWKRGKKREWVLARPEEMPKAHTELKGDEGRWDRREGEKERWGYSCLIACPTCRLDVSRCPIYSCSLLLLLPLLLLLTNGTGRLPAFDCLVIRRLVAHHSRWFPEW